MRDNLDEIIRAALTGYPDEILVEQSKQLLEGKRPDGTDLRPYYSEDLRDRGGWFHTSQTAANYAAWKASLSYPYEANRNEDAPNLYINGKFHSELGVIFDADSVLIAGTTPYAAGIVAKYGLESFGLSPERWAEVFEMGAYNDLMEQLKQRIYG